MSKNPHHEQIMSKKSNTVRTSQVTMHELVLPNDTNNLGNVLGGRVMHLMDICAAMSAYKHARTHVVTASVDEMNFLAPAKKGFILDIISSNERKRFAGKKKVNAFRDGLKILISMIKLYFLKIYLILDYLREIYLKQP